ncbi:hypothetical protein ACWEFL_28755 [Streptomyces sp. NPDC004838]
MAHWIITAQTVSSGSEKFSFQTVRWLEGTREEAEAALRQVAGTFLPDNSLTLVKRRLVYRYTDGHAYYVRITTRTTTHKYLFRAAELVHDTDWPDSARPPSPLGGQPGPSPFPEPNDRIPPGYE